MFEVTQLPQQVTPDPRSVQASRRMPSPSDLGCARSVGERVVAMSCTPFARGLLEQSMTCGDRSWQEVDPRRSRGPASSRSMPLADRGSAAPEVSEGLYPRFVRRRDGARRLVLPCAARPVHVAHHVERLSWQFLIDPSRTIELDTSSTHLAKKAPRPENFTLLSSQSLTTLT